jgi:uncharacterized protein (TIGR02117 family)
MSWKKPIQKVCFNSFIGAILSAIVLTIGYYTPRKWSSSEKTNCNWQICIENNGAHTNIIVPVGNDLFAWSDRIDLEKIDSSSSAKYRYLSFGWGDRDFYLNTPTWDDLDWSLAFKALFLPTPSVMEVKGLNNLPNHEDLKCVAIDRAEYINLMDYIDRSFQTDRQGEKVRIANGHFNRGGFYAAEGTYSILNTCNDWTAIGLRKADLNTPLWSGLSTSIMRHLKSNCTTD